ncbi:MAG TPA: adenosylcobinamide-GDP ribazoletransferase [Steroidobacteraceae bacterium]|jgi:adenosylcobinamide-GDP ribazoletransferase|nr:adenosylcobinamide-GDP ribazoletransferase [Steroidobacteraceae bacterium]
MVPRQVSLLLVATQFLTRLPVQLPAAFQPTWLAGALRYFPLVGGLVGALNVAVWWLCSRLFPPIVAVGLMLSASLLLTGAFHEDGFADTCDGFGGGNTPERTLAIMKDSRIGAYGAIGIFMMLALKWATIVALPAVWLPLVIVSAHVASRWCALGLIWRLRYVRSTAEQGKSQPFDGGLSGIGWVTSGLIGAAVPLAVAAISRAAVPDQVLTVAGAGLAGSAFVAVVSAGYFKSRIGGYTGDCLGAVQQVSELAFLLGALVPLTAMRAAS